MVSPMTIRVSRSLNDLGLCRYLGAYKKLAELVTHARTFHRRFSPINFQGGICIYDMLVSGRINALTLFLGVLRCTKLC